MSKTSTLVGLKHGFPGFDGGVFGSSSIPYFRGDAGWQWVPVCSGSVLRHTGNPDVDRKSLERRYFTNFSNCLRGTQQAAY